MKQINIFKKFTSVILTIAVGIMSVPAITVNAQEDGVQTPDSSSNSSEVQVQDNSSNVVAAEASNASNVEPFIVDNIEYTISDETAKTCYVSGNTLSEPTTVTIEAKVTNPNNRTEYNVTGIGDNAFADHYGNDYLTSISIPASVTSIGDSAFYGCNSLTGITIPDNVTKIGQSAFETCKGLKSIKIPNKASIGNSAFEACSGLESIEISDGVTSIGDHAFYNCTALTSVTIPDSVTSIGDHAFGICYNEETGTGLTSVTIGSGVTSIGNEAFCQCSKLTTVTFGQNSNLMSIGTGAFSDCIALTSIEIPSSVTKIDFEAFEKCTDLTYIKIPEKVTDIRQQAFDGCTALKAIDVDSNNAVYQSIDGVLYTKDPNTKTIVTYPAGKSGSSYTIDSDTKTIGAYAFSCYSSLESITIPSSVTGIYSWAFYDCTNLKSITIPSSVKKIDYATFYSCHSLENINIPSGVEEIGSYAFCNCNSLKSITIPSNIDGIGYYAFLSCESLTTVTFEEGSRLNFIGGYAFSYCPSLENIIIPSGVSHIGQGAFEDCTSLKDVLFPSTNTGIVLDKPNIFDNTPISTEGGGNFYTSQTIKDNCAVKLGIPDSNFKIIDLCPQEPAKPSNLKVTPKISASSNSEAEVIVSWDAVTPPAETVGYHKLVYQLQRSTDGGTTWENVKSLVTDTTVQDTVSGDLTQTQYRVAALNQSMGSEAGGAFENVVVATTQGQYSSDTGGQTPTPTPDDGGNNGAGSGTSMAGTSYSSGSAKTGDNTAVGVVGLTALAGLGVVAMLRRRRRK